jgi:hypothetical protein
MDEVPAMRTWARETLKPTPPREYHNADEWGSPYPPINVEDRLKPGQAPATLHDLRGERAARYQAALRATLEKL